MNEAEPNPNMELKCPQCGAPLPSGVLAGLCPACLFKQGAAADTVVPPETAPFQPPGVEEVARLFPQLEIMALLGKGGMGAVYQARQRALDRIVALKILPPQTAGGPGFIERFNREARALARLNHPNIVAVYEFGQVNGLPFFIMEFVDGLNLRELERAGKLSAREALQIVPQICEALQFAHDEGIVHRDIKPENILLDKKGRVKIADFGIAKILGGTPDMDLTQTKGAIGTPHYMAPEQMEKPTTVDHRADIFSLGVVFYEMLTGELPLGKFAPPSSRKVEVDVRLDDVVLRALEKDPERRYQHASQVKTAVDTIAGSATPPLMTDAAKLAQEILSADYKLNVGSCVRRSWALLKGEFWPFVGITALVMVLLGFVSAFSGVTLTHEDNPVLVIGVAMLVWGPLMGGLLFYFLKKIRRESATVETAFGGFSHRFLQLCLAGFITSLVTWLGFWLVLPGIYLMVAWMFALPLVVDKQLDFWSAMELSRKVVTKHWFKCLGFGMVLMLLTFAGVLALIVGVLVISPLVLVAMMYAYEDIFGGTRTAAAPVGTGPSGTVVLPVATAKPPVTGTWTLATKIGLAAVVLVIGLFVFMPIARHLGLHFGFKRPPPPETEMVPESGSSAMVETATPGEATPPEAFGPVIEQELQAQATRTNQFLNLETQQLLTPPSEIASVMASQAGEDTSLAWEALDIPQESPRFQYIRWLQQSGVDLMYEGESNIFGFDGIFLSADGDSSMNSDDWSAMTPEQVRAAVETPVLNPYNSAPKMPSRGSVGPVVNLLMRKQSMNWYFKTRAGRVGVLQLVSFSDHPPVAKIRYKLVQPVTTQGTTASAVASKGLREQLSERLEAASSITDYSQKDKPLAALAADAAKAGEAAIAANALGQMYDQTTRDTARHEAALQLVKRGLRKPAIEIAKGITDYTTRNQTLAELAQ